MPFLLTTETWIPTRARDGTVRELGLFDVLAKAHELESVHDASPLVSLALHRLLLAVLHRVHGPADLNTWRALYTHGRFEPRPLQEYFDAQAARLDLSHPERPFYQVRGLSKLYPPDGIGRLLLERSNYGAAAGVFQHRPRRLAASDGVPMSVAARHLIALQAFAPGGLVRKKDEPGSASAGPLNRGAFVLVRGKSVFDTLMRNLLVYAPERGAPIPGVASEDVPAWEADPLPRPLGSHEPSRRPRGWIDLLTWQSRRIELVVEGEKVVGVVYCVGQGLDDEGLCDPMRPFRADESRGLVGIDLSEERAVWRDSHALIRRAGADGAKPPMAVDQLANFALRSVLGASPSLTLEVLGMRGDRAEIRLSRHERVVLPSAVLADDERIEAVRHATTALEGAARAVGGAVWSAVRATLAPGGREPDKEDVRRVVDAIGAERLFWGRIASSFESFLDQLGSGDPDAAFEALAARARTTARDALRIATAALGTNGGKLQGAALAERRLFAGLNDVLPARQEPAPAGGEP